MKTKDDIENEDYDTTKENQREMWFKYVDGNIGLASQEALDARYLCIKYAYDERRIADMLVRIGELLKEIKSLKSESSCKGGGE